MLNYLVFIAAALIGFLLRQLEIPIPLHAGRDSCCLLL